MKNMALPKFQYMMEKALYEEVLTAAAVPVAEARAQAAQEYVPKITDLRNQLDAIGS
jgi:hypothetical protein